MRYGRPPVGPVVKLAGSNPSVGGVDGESTVICSPAELMEDIDDEK